MEKVEHVNQQREKIALELLESMKASLPSSTDGSPKDPSKSSSTASNLNEDMLQQLRFVCPDIMEKLKKCLKGEEKKKSRGQKFYHTNVLYPVNYLKFL
jgi:hypothetical protein